MFVREYLGNVAARDKEASMSTKRKDIKGRILRDGEIQKADGRYEFRYYDVKGERRSIYSWRLTTTDPIPVNANASASEKWSGIFFGMSKTVC